MIISGVLFEVSRQFPKKLGQKLICNSLVFSFLKLNDVLKLKHAPTLSFDLFIYLFISKMTNNKCVVKYIVRFNETHFKIFDELYEYLKNIDELF